MKRTLNVLILLTVITMITPFSLQAKTVSMVQVKQNVRNLQKLITDGVPSISIEKFKDVLGSEEKFILLDVRSEKEFNASHILGAMHVERGRIEWIIPNIIKKSDRKIYVYCRTGARSSLATERLHQMGYADVVNITGGFRSWVTSGYTVYNQHGEFQLAPAGFEKKEPTIGNLP